MLNLSSRRWPSRGYKNLYRHVSMNNSLGIDEKLLDEAFKVGGLKSKEETVNEALRQSIRRQLQQKAIDLFGKLDFDPTYDYKKERQRKRGGSA